MIIFGTRSKISGGEEVRQAVCSSCGNAGINMHSAHSYFHVYWIPVFPYKRETISECQHCKEARVGKEIPPEYHSVAGTSAGKPKPPLYMFSGLMIFAIIMGVGYHSNRQETQLTTQFLASPQINDLYIVKAQDVFGQKPEKGVYTVLQVKSINGEAVQFVPSRFLYSNVSGAENDISDGSTRSNEYFAPDTMEFDKTRLNQLHGNRSLKRIVR